MIITFTNVIGAIRTAFSVVRSGLKMWLGFETSETLGREEVVNGDFSDGTNDWTTSNSTISIEGGALKIISTGGNRPQANQIVSGLNIGSQYKLSAIAKRGTTANDVEIEISGVASASTSNRNTTTEYETIFYIFTATATSHTIQAKIDEGVEPSGTTAYFSNVSLKELTQITPDKSGNNNVGELFTGKALEFNGSTEYVDVSGLSMSGSVSTFAFWINSNDTLGRIIDINPSRFIISFDSNQLSLYSGSWKNFGTISTNVWNRCVVVTNGTSAKCYVNGVQLGVEKTINAINIGSATDAMIGSHYEHNQSFFDGEMSDFQIYNAAWSTDDIAYDYANPNKLAIDNPSTSLNVTNLKGYWALSEGDGLVAYDSGTNLEEDVVDNGDFALDSDWSEGDGWDIDTVNNKITRTAQSTSTSASQGISFVSGKSYSITYTLDVSAGSFLIRLGTPGILDTPARSISDTYTEVITATANHTVFNLRALNGTFAGSISNVSVREVTASDHGGLINGADYVLNQPRIPQLGMQNWAKSTPVADEITLIPNPAIPTQDILGNAVRDRLNSFNLDGSGYSSVANSSTLQFGTSAFTIQAWIKPFSLVSNNRILTKGVIGNGEFMISVGGDNASVRVFAKDSNGNSLDTTNFFSTLTINSWQMITVIIDTPNDQILFFKNDGNVETNTGASWTGNFNNTEPITIGNTSSVSAGQFFDGLVSDALVYDRELTSDEVENNYNAGLSAHTN